MGKVIGIYIATAAGEPVSSVKKARALKGAGLLGDRYGAGIGAFSNAKRKTIRQVSLIAIEDIEEANAGLAQPFTAEETRRNILTEDVELLTLIGQIFTVGGVRMRGIEDCTPCRRPSNLSGKPDFATAFTNCGGLRAEILESGDIQVGDSIITLD